MQQPQIFISHARADAQFVDAVARAIVTLGYQPWIDRQQLAGSQRWSQELEQAIAKSHAFILILTPRSQASVVVQQEYRHALQCDIPIIVVRTQATLAVPAELAQRPTIDTILLQAFTARLYVLCRDLGLPAQDPIAGFNSATSGAIYLAFAGRGASKWSIYQTSSKALALRALGGGVMTLAIWVFALSFLFFPSHASPYALVIALLLAGLPSCIYTLELLLAMRRALPEEMLVLTPLGIAGTFLRWNGLIFGARTQTFAFAEVERLTQGWTWWGAYRLTFTWHGQFAHFVMPMRLGKRRVIARQIATDWQTYRHQLISAPALSFQENEQKPLLSAPPAAVAAPTIVAPHYALIASSADASLIRAMEAWLKRRGIMPLATSLPNTNDGILLPPLANIEACDVVFIITSDAVLRSPQLPAMVAAITHRHKPLIPIRTSPQANLPGELGQVQWIDFSPARSRDNSFLDLCDALDRLGCLTPPAAMEFDVEWVMARAKHQRPLPNWQVYWPEPRQGQSRPQPRKSRQAWGFLLVCGIIGSVVIYHEISIQGWSWVAALSTLPILGAFGIFGILNLRRQRRIDRFNSRVAIGYFIPDMIVLTPQGIIIHVLDQGQRFTNHVLRRPQIVHAEAKQTLAGRAALAIRTQQETTTITLFSFAPQIAAIAAQINEIVAQTQAIS